jgi:hypothetical protein
MSEAKWVLIGVTSHQRTRHDGALDRLPIEPGRGSASPLDYPVPLAIIPLEIIAILAIDIPPSAVGQRTASDQIL